MRDYKAFVKYSKAGPRYTSYPTAVEFNTNFKYEEYIEILKSKTKLYRFIFICLFAEVLVISVAVMLFIPPKKKVRRDI